MYRLLYKIYNKLQEWNENNKDSKVGKKFCRLFTTLIFHYMNSFEIFFLKHGACKNGINSVDRSETYIISMTSFPGRINTVWITIETLFRQSFKADKIILWLADSQFPNGISDLPVRLVKMQERGLEIKFCDDLRSYKKFYYSMKEYPNANIITVDDDGFYPFDFNMSLVKTHHLYPNDIICRTAPQISPLYCTSPSKWNMPLTGKIVESYKLSINSGSGALFPPNSLPIEAFNKDVFKKICPYADDLWLTVMAHINGTHISRTEYHCYPIIIKGSQNENLCSVNRNTDCNGINNDTQWKNLIEKYEDRLIKIVGDFFKN